MIGFLQKRNPVHSVLKTSSASDGWFVNPYAPNAPFLYLLKTSENLTVQKVEKGCIGNEWVNP